MSTQRLGGDQVVFTGVQNGTLRDPASIISSGASFATAAPLMSSSLANDVYLNGIRYSIERQIARSGEAEVFLVLNNGNNFIFKYYYSQFKPKDEILAKLKKIRHPYIIALFDYGYFKERFFEVSEYAQGGTLVEKTALTSVQKTREIVEQAAEGLHYCHSIGIIHRDIKPENIFYRTTAKREIAIGDFGIASNVKEGEELVRTTMARTSLYAAPELFTNIQGKTTIEKSVDYYALGMSLLHLWFGRDPFEDVDEFGIMRLKSEGRVLFPDHIDNDVEKLIKGLITVNPRERWGYDEVKGWLRGDDVKVFYQTVKFDFKPYAFGYIDGEQIVVSNPDDLVTYLEKYPDKGQGHLYRNSIAKWVEPVDPGLFNELMDIVERDFPNDKAAGLIKAVYILDQERPFKGFDNTRLRTQEEIAEYFEKHFDHYKEELQNPNAPFFIFLEARNYKENANEYRTFFTLTNPEAALNTLIFKLEGADKFVIGDYSIYQPEELLKVDDATAKQIVNLLSNMNSKLSIWISNFKKLSPTIEKWHVLQRYDTTTLRYALQQGFAAHGLGAGNAAELYELFKSNLQFFFPDDGDSSVRDEADYWLKHYQDSSFCRLSVDYLSGGAYSDKEFVQLIAYALSEFESIDMNLYQMIGYLLPIIRNKKPDNKKTGNKIYFNNIVDILEKSFALYWDKAVQRGVLFKDLLAEYVAYIEQNINVQQDLLAQLTIQLDPHIKEQTFKDIKLTESDEPQTYAYRDNLGKMLTRIRQMNIDLPYTKRYGNENTYLNARKQDIKVKIAKEKQDKIKVVNAEFDKLLDKHKKRYSDSVRDVVNFKLFWYVALGVLGFVFLAAVAIDNATPLTLICVPIIALAALLGARIGSLLVVKIMRTYEEDNATGGIIGMYLGLLAANHYKGLLAAQLPKERALNAYGFYKEVPESYLYLFALAMAAVFGLLILLLMGKRKKEVGEVTLKPAEQDTLSQNMVEIDKHFAGKEVFEYFQEFVRVVTLDDATFEKEFSKMKP